MKTKLGIPTCAFCRPLREILEHEPVFSLDVTTSAEVAKKLREGDIQAGLVSPIEYARESSEYRILPGLAISSRSAIALYFREGIRSIRTLAAEPSLVADIVLARIVLAEEFEIRPAIVPLMNCSLDRMLARGDSALLSGDAFITESGTHRNNMDLVELWVEMVDLPYVHGFFCAREGAIPDDEVQRLCRTGTRIRALLDSERDRTTKVVDAMEQARRAYIDRFSYNLTRVEEDAIVEFISYAHYHGFLADIPGLRFYPGGMAGESPVSRN